MHGGFRLRANASTDALFSGLGVMQTITLVGGSTASTLTLYDALTQTGTPLWELKAAANEVATIDFPAGLRVGTGISATLGGTGALAYISIA